MSKTIYSKLDTVLEEIIDRWGIPGLGVGIVKDGQIVYRGGFGVQSLETGCPIRGRSIFCVQSISKCFTACAVMQLVEQDKVLLDDPIIRYLPYFRLSDDWSGQITVRQLLSHTSGTPDMDEVEYDEMVRHPEYDDEAAERFVQSLDNRKMVAKPGERFWYSNIGYNVLGDLIAKISGLTFEEYMRVHILQPSAMQESTFLVNEVEPASLVMPHLRSPKMVVSPIYPYHRADSPASWLHATVTDMCNWIITCLNQGTFNGESILNPASFDSMWTPAVSRSSTSRFYKSQGLGWTLGEFEGRKTVSHGGGGFGWTGFLSMMPEEKCGFIILCNEESTARERIINAAAQAMLGIEPDAGSVSWMVPVAKAMERGGIGAARAWYEEYMKSGSQDFDFGEYDLVSLSYQLVGTGNFESAVEVLKLNIEVFPGYEYSYVCLARVYLKKGDVELARKTAQKALEVQPGDPEAEEILSRIVRQI